MNPIDWITEIRSVFRITIQERRVGAKWEVSLARKHRTELAARRIRTSSLISFVVVPVYVDCLMLNIENNVVTGISRLERVMVYELSPNPFRDWP